MGKEKHMMKLDKSTLRKEIVDYIWISLGIMVYVVAFQGFMMPSPTIVGGGTTGVAQVIYYISNGLIPTGLSYFIINGLLLVISLKVLGPSFGIKTVYAMCFMSALLSIAPEFFPVDPETGISVPLVKEMFPRAVIAGLLVALGVFMAISHGGSTGGTDIVVMMICKYRDVTPGRLLVVCDGLVILSRLLYNQEIEPLVFGFVIMGVMSYTLDMLLAEKSSSAQVFVFTENWEVVSEYLGNEMHRGITLIEGMGWYSKKPRKIIMIVVRKTQAHSVLRLARKKDPTAFISVAPLMGVYGRGFDELKR